MSCISWSPGTRLQVLVGVLDALAVVAGAEIQLRQRLGALDLLAGRHLAGSHLLLEQARCIGIATLLQVDVPEQLVDLVLVVGGLRAGCVSLLDRGERLVPLALLDRVLGGLQALADVGADFLLRHGDRRHQQPRGHHSQAAHRHDGGQNESCLAHRSPHWGEQSLPATRKSHRDSSSRQPDSTAPTLRRAATRARRNYMNCSLPTNPIFSIRLRCADARTRATTS